MRIGIDLLRADELDRLTTREWFMRYIFADVEVAQAATLTGERRREFLAGRFAAKEAVLKVLGIGLFQGVPPRDIAVGRLGCGAPDIALRAGAARAARQAQVRNVTVSITHKDGMVAAVAAGW
jgi:holo-[acyl-carrier protein] synthase